MHTDYDSTGEDTLSLGDVTRRLTIQGRRHYHLLMCTHCLCSSSQGSADKGRGYVTGDSWGRMWAVEQRLYFKCEKS